MPILVKNIVHFFDKLEDYVRGILSKYPIPYAFVGGVSIVLFWRGVWHTADMLQARGGWWEWFFYEPHNLIIAVIVMLMSGLFVSFFIGDTILISGIRRQKKATEKTEKEVQEEEEEIKKLNAAIKDMKKEIDEIKQKDGPFGIMDLKIQLDEIRSLLNEKGKGNTK